MIILKSYLDIARNYHNMVLKNVIVIKKWFGKCDCSLYKEK